MTGRHLSANHALMGLVFLAGIGSTTTEICASRLLAPFFGSSTIVWANIIGMVLASLSIGYWLGGRLADRHPSTRLLGWLVLAGAVLLAAVPFIARPFLNVSVHALDQLQAGALIGSQFVVIMPHRDRGAASASANHLQARVRGLVVPCSASASIAEFVG